MVKIGFTLSSEEHRPRDLVRYAALAEAAGFDFEMISDHFHPWVDAQGQSPFVWSVLGAVAQVTSRVPVATAVTCPTIRTHPAIVAQAAATVADMMPGRFKLGLGTGENLNEHILGDRWPKASVRRRMLAEAIEVIRLLWSGGMCNHEGAFYKLDNARIYTLPDELPQILISGYGKQSVAMCAEMGDGFIAMGPRPESIEHLERAGGGQLPRYAQIHVSWANTDDDARSQARTFWPNAVVPGELNQELPLPRHYEQATQSTSEDEIAESIVCARDPEPHLDAIRKAEDAGYDHVYVHQIGPNQETFVRFYESEVLPKLR
jgi:coenzyme F420-dependent glucose-6-phosphate dehydrogenase